MTGPTCTRSSPSFRRWSRRTIHTYVEVINHLLRTGKPILATGGGGYHVENTVRAWSLAWTVLSDQDQDDGMGVAIGGVMLESTDWQGGLRDRELKETVLPALEASIETLKAKVFPIHGL